MLVVPPGGMLRLCICERISWFLGVRDKNGCLLQSKAHNHYLELGPHKPWSIPEPSSALQHVKELAHNLNSSQYIHITDKDGGTQWGMCGHWLRW